MQHCLYFSPKTGSPFLVCGVGLQMDRCSPGQRSGPDPRADSVWVSLCFSLEQLHQFLRRRNHPSFREHADGTAAAAERTRGCFLLPAGFWRVWQNDGGSERSTCSSCRTEATAWRIHSYYPQDHVFVWVSGGELQKVQRRSCKGILKPKRAFSAAWQEVTCTLSTDKIQLGFKPGTLWTSRILPCCKSQGRIQLCFVGSEWNWSDAVNEDLFISQSDISQDLTNQRNSWCRFYPLKSLYYQISNFF